MKLFIFPTKSFEMTPSARVPWCVWLFNPTVGTTQKWTTDLHQGLQLVL